MLVCIYDAVFLERRRVPFMYVPNEGEVAEINISAEVLLRGLLDFEELRAQVLYALEQ